MAHIKHGFSGQRMLILPFSIISNVEKNPLINDLFIRSLGYFPNARHHYITRPKGCLENILIYCVKGKGWFTANGFRQTLTENQFVLLESLKSHKYGADEADPWSIYWIHFRGTKAYLLDGQFNRAISVVPDDNSRINNRLQMFEEIFNVLSESFLPENLNYANLCFGHFLGTLLYVATYRKAAGKNYLYSNSMINRATHYINENLENKLKLVDIAAYTGYSSSYFSRIFYKEIGCTPMTYVTKVRIQKACYYLLNSSLKINQIAFKVGFNDPYYFSRAFARIMEMSPKEYRNQQKKI